LVLGATGGIGGEVARRLVATGWRVRALHRQAEPGSRKDGLTWIRGDAMVADDVAAAAVGTLLIVHAVNPPGYRHWGRLVLPMLDNSIAAARRHGATIVLPGTLYNYGPDAFPVIGEDAPQHACSRKGAIRVEMERRLRAFAESGQGRVIIVRAGDFFGGRARNNWFSQAMIKPGQPLTTVQLPSAPGVGHQFAYLPDVAVTMVRLLALRDTLPAFANLHMAGHWDSDGKQLAQAVQRVVSRHGAPSPRLVRFPWWQIWLAAPFVATLRELLEMRYLWQNEVRMDNAHLLKVLGSEPHTPWDEAVATTLQALGCLK